MLRGDMLMLGIYVVVLSTECEVFTAKCEAVQGFSVEDSEKNVE